jgi:hypothetical protein
MKRKVVYTVTFECTIEAEAGNLDDAISNIDIPEGGANDSEYCQGSFSVIDIATSGHDEHEDPLKE